MEKLPAFKAPQSRKQLVGEHHSNLDWLRVLILAPIYVCAGRFEPYSVAWEVLLIETRLICLAKVLPEGRWQTLPPSLVASPLVESPLQAPSAGSFKHIPQLQNICP